jgi:hypothetical protein
VPSIERCEPFLDHAAEGPGASKGPTIKEEMSRTKRKAAVAKGRPKADDAGVDAGDDTFRRSIPTPLFLLTKIPVPMSLRP